MAEIGLVLGREELPADIDLDFLEPCVMGRFVGDTGDGSTEELPNPTATLIDRPIRGAAILFPGWMKLADPEYPLASISRHLGRVASSLGAHAEPGSWVVLGSGMSRTIPDHVERQPGLDRLAEVAAEAHRILSAEGLEVMLEPLRQQESNVFLNLDEGAEFLDRYDLPLRMVCDTFHLVSEGRNATDALRQLDRIGHVHLSGHDRLPVNKDADAVLDIAVALQDAGYDGRWSFECRWDEPTDLADSIAVTRQRLG